MNNVRNFIEKHAVWFYFALTIAITWGGILLVIGMDGILGRAAVPQGQMPLLYMAVLLGPSLAGLLMTAWLDGKTGLRSLFSRLGKWQVGLSWYAFALLTAPVIITILLFLLSRVSPAYEPAIFNAGGSGGLLLTGIVMGLAVGFFEELGWTGFALPRLREKYGLLATGSILGFFWGLWHLPLFTASLKSSGAVPPALYLCVLLFSFLPAYRVLMAWLYERTGSLLLALLMHAPLSASQLILIPVGLAGEQLVVYNLAFTAVLWLVAVVVLNYSRKHNQ